MKTKPSIDLTEFYDFRMLSIDNIESIFNDKTRVDYMITFLMRIFWKSMMDLDSSGTGYNIIDWSIEDYYKFFCDNISEIDLNQESYKIYFEELVKYVILDIKSKNNN